MGRALAITLLLGATVASAEAPPRTQKAPGSVLTEIKQAAQFATTAFNRVGTKHWASVKNQGPGPTAEDGITLRAACRDLEQAMVGAFRIKDDASCSDLGRFAIQAAPSFMVALWMGDDFQPLSVSSEIWEYCSKVEVAYLKLRAEFHWALIKRDCGFSCRTGVR